MTQKLKYPRTPHFIFSNPDADDIISDSSFEGKQVVASIKMDGECTCLSNSYTHARSLDSKHHPSRSWVKQLQAGIGYKIPDGYRVYGENMFATHQIHYRNLMTYFFVYCIIDETNRVLSWEDTIMWADELGLCTVPVFYKGVYDIELIQKTWENFNPFPVFVKKSNDIVNPTFPDDFIQTRQEGFVVRLESSFLHQDFGVSVAKYVRDSFKQNLEESNKHWATASIFPNSLD